MQENVSTISQSEISQYLSTNFLQLDGFDYKWNSLITNTPLLFEDIDYLRVKPFITEIITDEEISAYKSQNLREMYATFENMLICNLQYYDRIISFCTLQFLNYFKLSKENDSEYINTKQSSIITEQSSNPEISATKICWTPTKIWCCALANISSTKWELEYGFNVQLQPPLNNKNDFENSSKEFSVFQTNFELLYRNEIFSQLLEYRALNLNTDGFRETFLNDKTPNKKLSQVCNKFTRTSIAITETELSNIIEYIEEQSIVTQKLYLTLHNCMFEMFSENLKTNELPTDKFAIYVFNKEFYIHTAKFSIKVYRNELGKITKDYLANNYECFLAEEKLISSIHTQIEWAKYKLPKKFENDKRLLQLVLLEMLKNYYRDIICIKRMNESGVLSKISFTGVFDNIHVYEEFMFDNRCIKSERICMSKENAAKYVVERGYYIFGLEKDVFEKLSEIKTLHSPNEKNIFISHYINYCIPVMTHMRDVILLNNMSKNEIIDIYCGKELNPMKLNNKNIVYVERNSEDNLKDRMRQNFGKEEISNHKQIMNDMKIIQEKGSEILELNEKEKLEIPGKNKFKYKAGGDKTSYFDIVNK